jgi:hypothetical protein
VKVNAGSGAGGKVVQGQGAGNVGEEVLGVFVLRGGEVCGVQDAPSGYAENANLQRDAAMKTSLAGVDRQMTDAQLALENMKTNAAVLGESDINQIAADAAAKMFDYKYQAGRDAQADAYQAWQQQQAEAQMAFEQSMTLLDNEYRNRVYQTGLDQYTSEQQLQQAKLQAQYGDFTGYQALGIDTTQMEAEWARLKLMDEKAAEADLYNIYNRNVSTPTVETPTPTPVVETPVVETPGKGSNPVTEKNYVLTQEHVNAALTTLRALGYGYDQAQNMLNNMTDQQILALARGEYYGFG